MIKIFDANDRDFSTAGNIIIEPTKCREFKKKSLNGWYIEVEIPINYKEYIEKDKLCVIKTKSKLNPQAFRIADNIKYTNRKISFTAEHVMFDARNYLLLDVRPTNLNGTNALNYINERTDNVSPFIMFSNIENVNTAYFIRKNLLEAWTTIEERWNGIFDADNWNISFLQSIGNDNGETIIYGKNMQSMEIYEDWSSVVTKLYPVGYDGLMLSEQYLESNIKYEVPYTRTIDFQTDLEQEEQTQENLISELRQKAQKYLDENKYPKVSYTTVSNINDNMEIGDTIQVLHPLVTIKTEVLEYEYDVISKKIKSLTFGNFSRDVKTKFDSIKSSIYSISQTLSKQQITIKNQTDLINSLNKNGYVYIDDNEILILDKLPKEEAKNVWRFGLGGIGFSSNGYEGPFETAITMDGQINAKFITTGTMSVARIEGLADELSGMKSAIELNNQNIIARVETQEETIEKVQQQTNLNTDEIAKLGSTETIEGTEIKVDASKNPAKIYIYGNSEQETNENSPGPEHPTPIKNVGNNVNLFNKDTTTDGKFIDYAGILKSQETATVSDYIEIKTNKDLYVSGKKSTWVSYALYDKDKTFLSRTMTKTPNGTLKVTNTDCKYIRMNLSLEDKDTLKIQQGTQATPYSHFGCGSVDIKVQNKNLCTKLIKNIGLSDSDGHETQSSVRATSDYIQVDFNKNESYCISGLTNTLRSFIAAYNLRKEFLGRTSGQTYTNLTLQKGSFSQGTAQGTGDIAYLRVTQYENNNTTGTINDIDNAEIQLEVGDTETNYVEHEEQTIHFPFTEKQVLHKDDYLAEDGIHHKRKTVTLNGTENFTYESAGRIFMVIHDIKDVGKVRTADILSSHFKINNTGEEKTAFHYQKLIYFFPSSSITSLTEWKAWLDEQYEAGTPVTIEYELANEEIVPYTPLQEDAMNSIYTFKGINYISCINSVKPEKLVLTYYPNTAYNETLVNKDTFDKVTTDMNAEFNIRANEIETSVKESTTSSILTLLNNGYLTAEQVNALVNGNAEDIVTIKEQLKQTVTSSQMQIEITKAIEDGVSYLKNTLFTIDENGMAIATNQDEFNALYNNKGMYLYSYEEMIAKFDVNGATITGNLTLEGEFITQNLRMINTVVESIPHTHIHWIGG